KPTALVLNIFVSGLSFYFYYRAKHFSWKLFYPFAMASIPFSFIGGYLTIDPTVYNIILGIFLFIAALRLLGVFGKFNPILSEINLYYALSIGAIIGFLSGLIGIGGGIVLSPVLYLLRWANIKQTAAISALFILVNSISGILGFIFKGGTLPTSSALLIGIVLTGGLLGAYYGSKKLGTVTLQRFLALVLIIAMIKLFII
ncbi:MAG TPA: sulfite exporter TauE/SafE family protein, partial [Saprospiraceae bacterium]|nr:sulfite exporter TauE/SafE family protein [Saprospiraceae bacterium]